MLQFRYEKIQYENYHFEMSEKNKIKKILLFGILNIKTEKT